MIKHILVIVFNDFNLYLKEKKFFLINLWYLIIFSLGLLVLLPMGRRGFEIPLIVPYFSRMLMMLIIFINLHFLNQGIYSYRNTGIAQKIKEGFYQDYQIVIGLILSNLIQNILLLCSSLPLALIMYCGAWYKTGELCQIYGWVLFSTLTISFFMLFVNSTQSLNKLRHMLAFYIFLAYLVSHLFSPKSGREVFFLKPDLYKIAAVFFVILILWTIFSPHNQLDNSF